MILFLEIFGMLLMVAIIYAVINHIYDNVLNISDRRAALDHLPTPIFFGFSDKYPLVVNDKMYELVYSLKGKPLTDMNKDFDVLFANRLKTDEIEEKLSGEFKNAFFVKFDGKVYGIEKTYIENGNELISEIIGQDVTEEYENLCKLIKLNDELKEQNQRLRRHFDNIAEVSRECELWDAKIGIHAKLGNSITMTRQIVKEHDDKDYKQKIIPLWEQIILGFSDVNNGGLSTSAGYKELKRISKTVGCEIIIKGELPVGKAKPFMIKVIREALNNAIRHANATSLTIDLESLPSTGNVYIYDDGKTAKPFTKMGGGLSTLKKYLEENGILFGVSCEDRFEIQLLFPKVYRK